MLLEVDRFPFFPFPLPSFPFPSLGLLGSKMLCVYWEAVFPPISVQSLWDVSYFKAADLMSL